MDETKALPAPENGAPDQVVVFAPELLRAAQQKQQQRLERLSALREAAESGDHAALLELAQYDLEEEQGQPRDAAEAFALLCRCPPEDPVGRYYLSYCYERGFGTEPDPDKALALLRAWAAHWI